MANNAQKQINEWLKKKGFVPTQGDKFPFFDVRKQLFGQLGQTDTFIGSENQNAFLQQGLQKAEKNVGVNVTPDNVRDVVGAGRVQTFEEVMASSRALQERIKTEGLTKDFVPPTTAEGIAAADKATLEGLMGEPIAPTVQKDIWGPAKEGATQIDPKTGTKYTYRITPEQPMGSWYPEGFEIGQPPIATPIDEEPETPLVPPEIPPEIPPETIAGTSATGLLPEMPTGEQLATQALEQIQTGAAFPLQLEAQEAQKAAVQLGAQRETESFIKNIASRGLIFSGAKAAGVSQIEADKLSELLGIDRKFALLMVQGLETAAQGIAKEAQKGRQEAIDSLESLGFAINPVTGNIEPTFAAKKAIATEERLAGVEERQERQFQLSVAKAEEQARQFGVTQERMFTQFQATQELNAAKFDLSIAKTQAQIAQANERIRISEENLRIAQTREVRLAETALKTNTYTNTQLGKLRAFDIDVSDTEAADTLLFKGEDELKKLMELREKGISLFSQETISFLPEVFSNMWGNVSSFFGF